MEELESLVKEFLIESYENLDQLDRDLVALEKEPQSPARLASIFRTIHTIKGTCGFFGFNKLEKVAHVGENLLSRLRDGLLVLNPKITTALLAMLDAVRQMLANIESTNQEGDGDYSDLIVTLTQLQTPSSETTDSAQQPSADLATAQPDQAAALAAHQDPVAAPAVAPSALVAPPPPEAPPKTPPPARASVEIPSPSIEHTHRASEPVSEPKSSEVDPVQTRTQQESSSTGLSESNIRVDVGLLDKLMNLVGELVLARNQILQYTVTQKDSTFLGTSQRLNLITTELQEGVMKTRMQPIGNIWNRFPRVVRDLAAMCGKQVRVEMEGKETELDKTIIEAIKDPLTHVVRNSVDHGIESPAIRVSRGKPAEGCLFLRAFHEGGQVNIEITDDGGGIDPERVKRKALERGLITPDQATRMSDRECINLIFLPGFSTAEKITNVSGRGVGMDVVKTNIEKIGGMVDIQSRLGKGTTLKVKIPLTLAIIPALVVTSGGDRYAIPQVSLLELVRLEGEQARKGVELIHGAPVFRLRGRLLPLVYLNCQLGLDSVDSADDVLNIVVLQADDRQFGLVVEGISDTEEIVVKPLSKQLKGIPLFAGATIMGDGKVALILDVLGIAQRASVVSQVRDRTLAEISAKSQETRDPGQTLLLFKIGRDHRMALPLSMIARLEEIPLSSIEMADQQEVVQYRTHILPILRLSRLLHGEETEIGPGEMLQVVVYTEQDRSVGLVVDSILDIVDTPLETQRSSRRPGVLGSMVIQKRVTDLLDVRGVISNVDPSFFEPSLTEMASF